MSPEMINKRDELGDDFCGCTDCWEKGFNAAHDQLWPMIEGLRKVMERQTFMLTDPKQEKIMCVVNMLMKAIHRINRMSYGEGGDHWDSSTMSYIAETAFEKAKEMLGVKNEGKSCVANEGK